MKALITDGLLKKIVYAFISLVLAGTGDGNLACLTFRY